MGAASSSALTACIGVDSGSAEGALSSMKQRLSSMRALTGMAQRRACAGRSGRAASARALRRPARLATTACKRSGLAAAQAAGVSVQEEQGAGGVEGLPALIPLDGALPCWQLPDEARASAACVKCASCSHAGKELDCLGCADESFADAHAFESYANWLIPGRLLVGRYPYVEPSRCRSARAMA